MESTSVPGNYICDMPVFLFPKTSNFSYGVGVTATIFWYYISSVSYGLSQKTGTTSGGIVGGTVGIFALIMLFQIGGLYLQVSYGKCNATPMGLFLSWLAGSLVGIIMFLIIMLTAKQYLPYISSPVESFTSQMFLGGGIGKPMPAGMVKTDSSDAPQDSEKSTKPNDSDEFVCDLYKNGQLITSTISE
jgi:hypothetical protein